ncbi:hypothetical protein CO218_04170 [Lactiplantibacillus plantarum]|jgi:VIT1/CCC1 family predicted Fe2+/Mn2+ transporter|nr:hypothetical protein CO218_04170 [Lactiplantibacillus plantarum]QBJ56075.1 hypothetical protein C3O83_08890 [Lactiplantibacillus plantarum]
MIRFYMSLGVVKHTILYLCFIFLLLYLKKRYPDNVIIGFFKKYGGVLLIVCFIYILSQFGLPVTAIDVPIVLGILGISVVVLRHKQK